MIEYLREIYLRDGWFSVLAWFGTLAMLGTIIVFVVAALDRRVPRIRRKGARR